MTWKSIYRDLQLLNIKPTGSKKDASYFKLEDTSTATLSDDL